MSNIFTQNISPAFTKQSKDEYFVDPMFMGEDVRGSITVRTDIKGKELLNKISRPSKITRLKTGPGFTPVGAIELTTQEIVVTPLAIEYEQNGREFWGSIMEMLLASGYKEDDVQNMSNPDVWAKIVLPIIAQAGQQDLIRQMWFGNTDSADVDYNPYDGFFKLFSDGIQAGGPLENQNIPMGTGGVLAVDEVDSVMDQMMATMPNEMLELNPVFRLNRRAYRNLFTTWKNLGTEIANLVQWNGIPTPHYEGVPILVYPEWDTYSPEADIFSTPGQIVLAPSKNLLWGTDGASDPDSVETWYNQEEQMRRYRVQYKAATAYLHAQLIMLAGLTQNP